MRQRDKLGILCFLLLGLLSLGMLGRVALHYQRGGALRLELGRLRLTTLTQETRERIDSLENKVLVTYYVSPPQRMPSSMRRMERHVSDLLDAMRARSPERFDFQIVDPEADRDENLTSFAAQRHISPMQVREVAHDSWDERKVWSSLSISYGAYPEAILHGIGPEHLPLLQATLVAWLNQLERPRAARIALAAPPGFQELEEALSERGIVQRVDLDNGVAIPDADLLVWMRPRSVTAEQRRGLDRLLEAGGSVMIAGGLYIADDTSLVELDGEPALTLRRSGFPAAELLSHYGLIAQPELVLDGRNDSLSFGGEPLPAPFLVRGIAPHQDFRGWGGQANGTLLFAAPTGFGFDTQRHRELGYTAQALASSSDLTWLQEAPLPPRKPLKLSDMKPENGMAAAKQALIVGLRHNDDWRGRLVVCGTDSTFADGLYSREHVAHRRLLRVLLDEMISDKRLVIAGAKIDRPEPIPPLSAGSRLFWRAICVGLMPLALLLFALSRKAFGASALIASPGASALILRPTLKFMAALAALLFVAAAGRVLGFSVDATGNGRNALSDEARAIAEQSGESGPVRVELLISDAAKLPPLLRPRVRKLERMLRDFRGAGADLDVERRVPEDLDESELAALRKQGLLRHQGTTSSEEVTTFRRYDASLRFSRGSEALMVPLPDVDAFELLEFHIAFALWRLQGNAAPKVVFATDAPRLSAAEDYQNFQQKGLFSPKGTDVYKVALERMARSGLDVSYINPRHTGLLGDEVDENVACLVWLQPRRSIKKMAGVALRYLVGGGNFILATQHFNIVQQQYRGNKSSGFLPEYWPRPQVTDVHLVYFPELSIELVREVLFDELSLTTDTISEVVGRGAQRIYERQEVSLPFQVRASASHFNGDSPLMRNLGDQAFIWTNHLRWDEERLEELGLRAQVLMTSSPRTYTFPWKGGTLPGEYLGQEFLESYRKQGEAEGDTPISEEQARKALASIEFVGSLPLGVLFEGTFPVPEGSLDYYVREPSEEEEKEAQDALPWPDPKPARLVFLGCSEFLKNQRILEEEFRGDQLLWNLVANMALPTDLAEIATRRTVAPGFGFLTAEQKLEWRSIVVGTPIAAILVLGLAWFAVRRSGLPQAPSKARAA